MARRLRLPEIQLPKRLSVGFKVAGLATVGMIAVLVLSAGINIYEAQGLVDRQLGAALRSAEASFAANVEAQAKRALTVSTLVAGMPSVQKALATKDRAALAAEFVPQFAQMRDRFDFQQMQFHLPPATSFLRVHRPERFGDDLTEIRPGVVETNTSKRPVSGLEIGREGLGLRGIVPILSAGQHVGSVEVGLSFDDVLLSAFKRQSGVDVALFLLDGSAFAFFAASNPRLSAFDVGRVADAIKETRILDRVFLDGVPHAVIASPVLDFSRRAIGISIKAIDRSDFDRTLRRAWQVSGVLAAIVLLLSLIAVWIINVTVGRPLSRMTGVMQRLSIGDLSLDYEPTGRRDEIGDLEKVLQRFRRTTARNKEMTAEQKEMVARQSDMLTQLSETAERVTESIDAIRAAASEISQGSNDLATRTERQAS
ncbi:MAG: HAMP domain-containing protein, partial [Rhodospirillaceae bacterium]|nr:HAMP domain-containing protein [Rhodospirillaceae bacterium]